ncbi:MAG: DUF808 domain-containing protein [Luteimonas sp.]
MASSFFALFDDIATLLDDVAAMTKIATRKTAGVLGDDLALNAEQVTGVRAERELPVVWAVAKGSLLNKAILVPAALLISAITPWAVTPLMMLGGAYLCYEGAEKLAHRFLHSSEEVQRHREELLKAVQDPEVDLVEFEKQKIKGAIRTDFILSAEIIVITLGTVATAPFMPRLAVLVAMALLITIGVYGTVAGIVKLDDLGLALNREDKAPATRALGRGVLRAAPYLMKFLSIAGTAAMFLVGGGILVHGIGLLQHFIESHAQGRLGWLVDSAFNAGVGIIAGAIVLAAVTVIGKLRRRPDRTGAATG